jgi:hypothetical protein
MSEQPISPLRRRMIEDMTRFGVLEQNSGAESQVLHRRCSD